MCGRFTLGLTPEELAEAFALDELPEGELPRYNIAPSQQVAALTTPRPRRVTWLRWGLVPSWARDPAIGARLINARAETLAEKPSFRDAFRRRRCLILADGFYEWKKEGSTKRPFHLRRRDGQPFAMAGLWEVWKGPDEGAEPLRTCAIVTTRPNDLVRRIHDRMPAILPPDRRASWLGSQEGDPAALAALLAPIPPEELEAFPVSPRMGSAAFDDPKCVEPVGDSLRVARRPLQPGLWEGDDGVD